MIKIENVVTPSPDQWESVVMGARNPMNSWDKSDSFFCQKPDEKCSVCEGRHTDQCYNGFVLGPNDQDLMMRLVKGGPVHAKYRRMITVYATITAPLYWWKEMDTYQVGVVKNSCSTMHKIHAKEFTLEDFSHEHLMGIPEYEESSCLEDDFPEFEEKDGELLFWTPIDILRNTIGGLNFYRQRYIDTKDKKYWWQMIQLLPSSYNQRRTVMLNYEVLANIYKWRKDHKLDEWNQLCGWIEGLPYSEIITGIDPVEVSEEHAYDIPDRPMKPEECEV